MVRVNLLEPKGNWYRITQYRGMYTLFYRQKGQCWQTCVQIFLWGLPGTTTSFYTARKVQKIVHYQPN